MSRLAYFERLLWVVGALCIGYCLFSYAQARAYSRLAAYTGHDQISFASSPPYTDTGTIEVPALGLKAPITADIDVGSLRLGVGHIRGTALPGGLGTVGLAGHRDSFFRPLRRIQPGMEAPTTTLSIRLR